MANATDQLANLGSNYRSTAYERITVNTLKSLTASKRRGAAAVRIDIEVANVRFLSSDLGTVSATNGGRMIANTSEWMPGDELEKMTFIEESAGAIINVTYYSI